MNPFILTILESIMLSVILSLDVFVCGFAYGTNKVKFPVPAILLINFICSGILALSLFFGSVVNKVTPKNLTNMLCFSILLILGIIELLHSIAESYIQKHEKGIFDSRFYLKHLLKFVDKKKISEKFSYKTITLGKAFSLGAALSLDGLAVGIGTGIGNHNPLQIIIFSFIIGIFAMKIGYFFGNKISEKIHLNLSWLSGALLIVLAFFKI